MHSTFCGPSQIHEHLSNCERPSELGRETGESCARDVVTRNLFFGVMGPGWLSHGQQAVATAKIPACTFTTTIGLRTSTQLAVGLHELS